MPADILLATDLDRTLLPNGAAPESALARPMFAQLAALPEVRLAYVTGRDQGLVLAAMAEYALPQPEFVIADVGTTLYNLCADDWAPNADWEQAIVADWGGRTHAQLASALTDITGLRLQEAAKQGVCKLSFYAAPMDDPSALLAQVQGRLERTGARTKLVWSVDETTGTGLLDVLPAGAGKLHALQFLRQRLGIALNHTVFAGDSGNDMEVLASEIPAVLMANAQEIVSSEAVAQASAAGHGDALYLAQGGRWGMNGNYSAGILEGVAHFIPAARPWLDAASASLTPVAAHSGSTDY